MLDGMRVISRSAALLLLLTVPLLSPALVADSPVRRMELVCELGPKAAVKIYSGETLTFRTREKQDGLSGLFTSSEYLDGVTFVLREWPKIRQDSIGIIKGYNRAVVREKKPGKILWGSPPSWFTTDGGTAGRYRLTATRPGYAPASVLISKAEFRIEDIEADLSDRAYHASFQVKLTDPDEKRQSIPLLVESLDADGRIVDMRKDVLLAPVALEMDGYAGSRRIRISSHVLEPFMERIKRHEQDPVSKEYLDRAALRIVEGGMIRLSFRNVQAVYPVPLGY
jgi:hypothetical protein